MAKQEDPEADVLDRGGLSALLNRRAHAVHAYYGALRNALLRGHGGALSDRERSLISNMLHVLIADVGHALNNARSSADNGTAMTLLPTPENGWASSAYDRLAKSGFLGDLELIRALSHRVAEHLLILKTRQAAPAALPLEPAADRPEEGPLGDAEAWGDPVMAEAISAYLVESSRRFDGYGNPRLVLHELETALRARLVWACAAAWREDIADGRALDETDLDEAVEGVTRFAVNALNAEAKRQAHAEALGAAMVASGWASAPLLTPLVAHGHVAVFEAVLARLLELPFLLVRSMTFEPGGARLAVGLRAAGMNRQDTVALSGHIAAMQGGPARDFPRAVDVFDACQREDAERLVREWRLRPEYVEALRRMRGIGAEDAL